VLRLDECGVCGRKFGLGLCHRDKRLHCGS
jgi:hypothetical protein